MNLFIVPSWYPSDSNPSYGIFVKEQIGMMARERPNWQIGVSTWGQGDHEKLIWVKDHIRNISKINKHGDDKAGIKEFEGYKEYYQPALSWTKKFRRGNLREIIRCNELNYQAHTLENGKPDIIMAQACYPGILIAEYLADKYDVPIHLHIRLGGFMFEKMLSELGSIRDELLNAINKAKAITVTSDFHGREMSKWASNTKTLFNPVDLDFFQIREENEEHALAIGRLENEKGFDLLLKAVAKTSNLQVKIVGSGTQEDQLRKQINKLNLTDRVNLVGERNREEVRELVQKSKFLILPSRYETFGNVLLEAMACGKPVVATKCGGPEEIVLPDIGYLTNVDADDLADKIQNMMRNYRSFNPEQIRQIAEDRFSTKNWTYTLENYFREIL